MQRKLSAILSADIVSYSGMMEADEAGTLERMQTNRSAIFEPLVASHGGRIFKLMGDGALVDFTSAVAAVDCALAIQNATAMAEATHEKPLRYRIGINLGEVIVDGEDVYGDGVNVAARLQTLAPAGGIALSRIVREQVEGKSPCLFDDLGEHTVKNITRAVHVFGVRVAGVGASAQKADGRAPAKSICVLPFANMSNDPAQEYFSDGISEDVITDLSKVSSLTVIARNTSFTFKGKAIDVQKVAREINVSHVLEGSVRKSGNRVRITAQLIDGGTGSHVWAERYDRDLNDIFTVQDEISAAIVSALKLKLLPDEQATISRRRPANLEAYDLYLRGSRPAFGPDEMRASIALLEAATRLAPDFADAWGALANLRANRRYFRPYSEWDETGRITAVEAARALAIDPRNILAMAAQYRLLEPFGAFLEAEAQTNRMMQEASRDGVSLGFRCAHLANVGRMHEAIEFGRRAIAIDPSSPYTANLFGLCLMDGAVYDAARQSLEATLSRWPDYSATAMNLILLSIHTGDWTRVDQLLAPDRLENFPLREFEWLAKGLAGVMRDPSPDALLPPLALARGRLKATGHGDFGVLQVVAKLGGVREAHDIAAEAKFGPAAGDQNAPSPDAYRTRLLFTALFPEFRRDVRFIQLCARLGLVDYWLETRCWPDCAEETAPYYDFKLECEKVRAGPPLSPAA